MVKQIIKEAMDQNPLGLKEAVAEELQKRVTLALEAKMKKMKEEDDMEDDEEDDDEDDEDDEDEDDEDDEDDDDDDDDDMDESVVGALAGGQALGLAAGAALTKRYGKSNRSVVDRILDTKSARKKEVDPTKKPSYLKSLSRNEETE